MGKAIGTRGVENPGGVEVIFVLGGIYCYKIFPREPHYHSVINNMPTGRYTLEFS